MQVPWTKLRTASPYLGRAYNAARRCPMTCAASVKDCPLCPWPSSASQNVGKFFSGVHTIKCHDVSADDVMRVFEAIKRFCPAKSGIAPPRRPSRKRSPSASEKRNVPSWRCRKSACFAANIPPNHRPAEDGTQRLHALVEIHAGSQSMHCVELQKQDFRAVHNHAEPEAASCRFTDKASLILNRKIAPFYNRRKLVSFSSLANHPLRTAKPFFGICPEPIRSTAKVITVSARRLLPLHQSIRRYPVCSSINSCLPSTGAKAAYSRTVATLAQVLPEGKLRPG